MGLHRQLLNKKDLFKMAPPSTPNSKASKMQGSSSQAGKILLDNMTPFLGAEMNQKTAHPQISMKNFSIMGVSMLMAHYKVADQNILNTTALAMSDMDSSTKANIQSKLGNITDSLESLAPYKQLFKEKDTSKLFSQEGSKKLLAHLGDLDMAANAALQTEILVSAMTLTGRKPAGLKMDLPSSKKAGLNRMEVRKRLSLLLTMSEILHQKSKTFNSPESNKMKRMHKDLFKLVADY